jgi:hypothetical protein
MIISFAWTTGPFLAGAKDITRRYWKDTHAAKFNEGDIVDVYNKLPIAGGEKIGEIRLIKKPYQQRTSELTEEDYVREGFEFMHLHNLKIFGKDPRVVFDEWKLADDLVWVVEFEKI